jgi:hypothetical protein
VTQKKKKKLLTTFIFQILIKNVKIEKKNLRLGPVWIHFAATCMIFAAFLDSHTVQNPTVIRSGGP